jgi:hypothetical protein
MDIKSNNDKRNLIEKLMEKRQYENPNTAT